MIFNKNKKVWKNIFSNKSCDRLSSIAKPKIHLHHPRNSISAPYNPQNFHLRRRLCHTTLSQVNTYTIIMLHNHNVQLSYLVLEDLDLGSGLAFDSLEQSIALLKNIELKKTLVPNTTMCTGLARLMRLLYSCRDLY